MSTQNYIYIVHSESLFNCHSSDGWLEISDFDFFFDLESAEKWRDFASCPLYKFEITKAPINDTTIPETFNKDDLHFRAVIREKHLQKLNEFLCAHQISGLTVWNYLNSGQKLNEIYKDSEDWFSVCLKANSIDEAREKATSLFEDWFNKNYPSYHKNSSKT